MSETAVEFVTGSVEQRPSIMPTATEQKANREELLKTVAALPTQELLERIAAGSFREQLALEETRLCCPVCRAHLSLRTREVDPLEARFGRIDPRVLEAEMRSRLSQLESPEVLAARKFWYGE